MTLLFYEPISEGQPPKFLKMTPEFCGDSFCEVFVEDFEGIEEDEYGKRLAIWVKNDSDIVTLILPETAQTDVSFKVELHREETGRPTHLKLYSRRKAERFLEKFTRALVGIRVDPDFVTDFAFDYYFNLGWERGYFNPK